MSTQVFQCPQCGAPVEFKSSIAVFAVCGSCRSMVVRRDLNVESLGTMAQLPPDLSPLQVGTLGEWHERPFEIIGRLRVSWADGSWNEWCAIFGDGQMGWIAEAQGIFMVAFGIGDETLPDAPGKYHAGQSLQLAGHHWNVTDIKRTTSLSGEGELPFVATPGSQRIGIDLISSDESFATVEFTDGLPPQLYTGAYAHFDELKFKNLRPVPGWSSEVQAQPGAGALTCPNCGAVINLRAVGQAVAAVCGSCGSIVNAADPNLRLIEEADARTRAIQPQLPLGTRGKLSGIDYEVIGYMERSDADSTWSEYLLFNPWQGFRWLVTYSGHWTLVDRLFRMPLPEGTARSFEGQRFDLFARGACAVQAVLGEFYWKVKRGEVCVTSDFIQPPCILSSEKYPDLQELTWSRGEYVASNEIAAAFGVKDLPVPSGIYLNQPNPYLEGWRTVRRLFGIFFCVLLATELGSCILLPTRPIFGGNFIFDRGAASTVLVSPHFRIEGRQQAVTVQCRAPVDNNWLGMDVTLVEAGTERTYPAELTIEYYHGVEDGESWSEGSTQSSVTLPAIPPGEYYLAFDTDADPAVQRMSFDVEVTAGNFFSSNFVIALLLLSLYPIYRWFRQRHFEQARWAQSSFPPPGAAHRAATGDQDDDS